MALVQMNFESRYLNNNHEISIILPDMPRDKTPAEFYGSGRKYKVLWLLHGTFGDHSDWIRKSNIELYACEKDLIVVMPSGLNANYANWEHFSIGYNMYDYLTEELMPLIYNWFPASDKREDNFIAGLSMGGSGTLVYALNHPEKLLPLPRGLRQRRYVGRPHPRYDREPRRTGSLSQFVRKYLGYPRQARQGPRTASLLFRCRQRRFPV